MTLIHTLAIDPGTTKSGWCYLVDDQPMDYAWFDNEKIYALIKALACPVVIEDIEHLGMPVGRDVFQTIRWTGRFDYLAREVMQQPVTYITRSKVKLSLCGSPRANDSTIRQAIIDRYGGDQVAIGGKKCKKCKGKGWFGRSREKCSHCGDGTGIFDGTGYETPPGVLKGISGHVWSALAVGLTYYDQLLINRV